MKCYRKNIILLLFCQVIALSAQESFTTHYFTSSTNSNPALAGDTRFGQFNMVQRLQPTTANTSVKTTLFSYNQKIRNMHSGIGVSVNHRSSTFAETQVRINYSYTALFQKRVWFKGGFGIGLNNLNTHITRYYFPDQYNNYGYNGQPTYEPDINRKASYVSFIGGVAAYGKAFWFSVSTDNVNRPEYNLGGYRSIIPISVFINGGYLISLNKNKRPNRILSRGGGLEPYSCIGPVVTFIQAGPLHTMNIGVNSFINPLFWGVSYRNNSIRSDEYSIGSSAINFMGGYRNESFSVAYSYDALINAQVNTIRGGHEISLIYYIYSVKEDYRKHELMPYPNQLKY